MTIRDVAQAAGVSTATVSRVMNGKASVADHLAERVRTAAAELGYRPNVFAKGLRTSSTMVIGLIVPDIENPFHTAIARGVEDAAQEREYSVLLCNSDEDHGKEARYLDVMLTQQVAGVVIEPVSERRTDVRPLQQRAVPVVAVDRAIAARSIDTVTVNNRQGARWATEALLVAGCRRIAVIAGPAGRTTADERLAGYRQALEASNLPVDEDLIVFGDYRVESGYDGANELLARPQPPDAIFVANNLMAAGALAAMTDRGLNAPRDLQFASFDEPTWNPTGQQPLCLIYQPGREMGRLATELLLQRIERQGGPVRHTVLEPTVASPAERSERLRRPPGSSAGVADSQPSVAS